MALKKRIKNILKKKQNMVFFYNFLCDIFFQMRIKPQFHQKEATEKIVVAFICQYIPAWNKFENIYRQMLCDERFEVHLICLPIEIENNIRTTTTQQNNTYDYLLERGYSAINALLENGEWFDLHKLKCDYVIYTRPYNSFLPMEYTSHIVCRYSCIVSLLYGMNMTKDTYTTTLNKDFFNDVSIFFAETETSKEFFDRQYPYTVRKGLRICKHYGMPAMEQILLDKGKTSVSWGFSKNKFRVMWTPRWTTKKELGGSNFFVYYKLLLKYADCNPDIDLLCRPHPLMFENFIKTGEMSISEIIAYKEKIAGMGNVTLDEEQEYDATMWDSSVMISDMSSIMSEYFVTGKPVIYCSSNMILTLAKHTEELIKGCYVAEEPKDVFKYLDMLKGGEDPLAETRKDVIQRIFGSDIANSSKKIVEFMAKHCIKNE